MICHLSVEIVPNIEMFHLMTFPIIESGLIKREELFVGCHYPSLIHSFIKDNIPSPKKLG